MRITKLSPSGRPPYSYPGEVVYRDETVSVVRCVWTGIKPFQVGSFALEAGDLFIECYYPAQWFNIFVIYDTMGRLKGWYCNLSEPPEMMAEEIRWHDLALDWLALPDGRSLLLDEDEFEALRPSPELRQRAAQALATLQQWRAEGRFPFGAAPLSRFDRRSLPG